MMVKAVESGLWAMLCIQRRALRQERLLDEEEPFLSLKWSVHQACSPLLVLFDAKMPLTVFGDKISTG